MASRRAGCRFLYFLGLLSAAAQEPGPRITVNSHLVQARVVVQDRKGRPAQDLTKDDFVLLDQGRPQQIAFFSVEYAQPLAKIPKEEPQSLTFTNRRLRQFEKPTAATVILVDAVNTALGEDMSNARLAVAEFLSRLEPGDPVGIYLLGRSGRVTIVHEVTEDPAWLAQSAKGARTGLGATPASLPNMSPSSAASDPASQALAALTASIDKAVKKERVFVQRIAVGDTLSGFKAIADHLAGIPGRKNLVWVSTVFPLSIGVSPESMQAARQPLNHDHLDSYYSRVQQITRVLNDAEVAVYPVDPRGLRVFGPDGKTVLNAMPATEIATMEMFAGETGGRAFYNANDMAGSIRRAIDDSQLTYVLGFYPSGIAWDGSYHKLQIKVNRPGFEVRGRRGYFATDADRQSVQEQDQALRHAAAAGLDATAIAVTVNVAENPLVAGPQEIVLALDPRDIHFQNSDGRWRAKLDILYTSMAPDGSNLGGEKDVLDYALLPETYERYCEERIFVPRKLWVKFGAARLRVVVRDETTGATGSVSVPVRASAARQRGAGSQPALMFPGESGYRNVAPEPSPTQHLGSMGPAS